MKTKTPFWRLLATVPFLALLFPGLAVCQEAGAASGGGQRPPLQRVEVTQIDYTNTHGFPHVLSPYTTPFVPDPRLDNSQRLKNLIVDGKLVLALDDAIALALENNLDIAVARYNLPIAQTDCSARQGGRRDTWRGGLLSVHDPLFRQSGRRCGGGGGGGGSMAREAPWEAGSTAWVQRDAVIRVHTPPMAGAMPSRL